MGRNNMRSSDEKKLEIIKKTLSNYGANFELPSNNEITFVGEEVFLVNKSLLSKIQNEKLDEEIISLGTQIGKFHKGNFLLGIESNIIMSPSSKKARLSDKGASLFLYGRDVFIKNLLNTPKKGFVVVSNKREEVIGLGKFDGKMLINILDRGSYLRILE
ncbi:MAG TPA: hypothetical protein PKK55_02865 [Methanofastidiosum sp.]|jgi:60S ribosome subunit biogenesis protein NIP7|nr:hypothetical protein [Methanofastidiosum sp.]HOC78108.1 hypothetical protein [Methanofastidiosum sp.]HOG73694.1 hypothetical protein [Methanofastidiosum sp.]HPA49676.1 hypothetical protein [Methanofastidiosum sp.]HQK62825.1 hypothetical protein [Methanofastidiosum sp.]